MAIPYLLGLAAGSIAVVSWKQYKTTHKILLENDSVQDSAQKNTDDETSSSDSPSTKTTSTKKKV